MTSQRGWVKGSSCLLPSTPPLPDSLTSLDECAAVFQKNIYEYFKTSCGLHKTQTQRKACGARSGGGNSINQALRKRLRGMKKEGAPLPQIQSVSAMFRRSLAGTTKRLLDRRNFFEYRHNPWDFAKCEGLCKCKQNCTYFRRTRMQVLLRIFIIREASKQVLHQA